MRCFLCGCGAMLLLLFVAGCQCGPSVADDSDQVARVAKPNPPPDITRVLEAKHHLFRGPEPDGFGYIHEMLTAQEIRLLHVQIHKAEAYINAHLAEGDHGMAWFAGYLRLRSSLPALRHGLLIDRYCYGWEGLEEHDLSAPLHAAQYTHHLAYIAAIEAITGRPVAEFVAINDAEADGLRQEIQVAQDAEDHIIGRARCARWLLQILEGS